LTDLPIAVLQRSLEGHIDLLALEGGQGDDRPTADGRLVTGGSQDRFEAGVVPDGPQSGDGCLAAQRILVVANDRAQRGDGAVGDRPALAERPRNGFDDGRIGVLEVEEQGGRSHGAPARLLRRPAPDRRVAVGQCRLEGAHVQATEAGQRPQGHHPHPRIRGLETVTHGGLVPPVPSQGHVLGRRIRRHGLKSGGKGPTERCRHHEKEKALSHMVIYRTADGQPGYHQADELDEAVRFVERLRNGDGVDGARIFKMEEVNFDFRPYFKVEIGPGGVPIESPIAPAFAGRDHGFSADLGNGFDAAPPAPTYEAPSPFGGDAWSEPEVPMAEAPVESAADLGLEPEPVPSFVAPPSVSDPSVIDALPGPPPDLAFEPPASAEGDDLDAAVGGPRRGLFGR
jgi:hypothetical protein